MRISSTEEYGLRCMLVLARGGPEAQSSISDIAEAEGISAPYASKLLGILRRNGLVEASRGRHGGFYLTRPADKISLLDVLTTLGGPLIDPDHCAKRTGQLVACVHGTHCSVHDVIGGLAGLVAHVLGRTSLQHVIDGNLPTMGPGSVIPLPVMNAASNGRPSKNQKKVSTGT
jgi:Rrf2 family protein